MTFVKGQSGNPGGRKPMTDEERAVKKLTKETFNDLSEKMMTCTKEELEDMIAMGLPFESELFIRMMLTLAEKGDMTQYQKYLDRRIGKVKEEVEINLPKPTIIQLSGDKQIVLGSERDEDE